MQFVTYTRVSTQEQGQSRNGIEGQDRALLAFIQHGGHEVLASFSEVASGKHGPELRPVLRQALAEVRRTGATLLVSKLDRLSRSVQFISALMHDGVRFATVEDGLEVEPMMLHMKAVFAEQERRLISERTKAGLASAKARGVIMGFAAHKSADGRAKAVASSAQAATARATSFAQGVAPTLKALSASMTYAQVAEHMNGLGVKTARNGRWHASTVSNALKRMAIAKRV